MSSEPLCGDRSPSPEDELSSIEDGRALNSKRRWCHPLPLPHHHSRPRGRQQHQQPSDTQIDSRNSTATSKDDRAWRTHPPRIRRSERKPVQQLVDAATSGLAEMGIELRLSYSDATPPPPSRRRPPKLYQNPSRTAIRRSRRRSPRRRHAPGASPGGATSSDGGRGRRWLRLGLGWRWEKTWFSGLPVF
jgi:hypothetical protein